MASLRARLGLDESLTVPHHGWAVVARQDAAFANALEAILGNDEYIHQVRTAMLHLAADPEAVHEFDVLAKAALTEGPLEQFDQGSMPTRIEFPDGQARET